MLILRLGLQIGRAIDKIYFLSQLVTDRKIKMTLEIILNNGMLWVDNNAFETGHRFLDLCLTNKQMSQKAQNLIEHLKHNTIKGIEITSNSHGHVQSDYLFELLQ
jgi:hypothetical protein